MTAECFSCGQPLVLTEDGRYPEHKGNTSRGVCGGSDLLPLPRRAG